ncbi:acyltransferase [Hymenobacter sp. BT664]|uniref:Acyltransferase n=1 Tax=Hymenobacter montanus TaxID=2771359 RepID=A0A927BDZ4_9BACT|nr:acyltransferase [Hymenobacter montanus]MBD2769072.1 acyltransferase [Hymenobacter montanus]
MKELNGLTGIRFLAAFYVFVFHIQSRFSLAFLPDSLETIISVGALGVNLFFVLSGFILTYVHLKDFSDTTVPTASYYGRFMLKRFARIYPAYLIGLVACLAVSGYLHDYPSPFLRILALDATMLESYFLSLSMEWYGGGAWSVSTEFFFYLLFPFLLPLLLRLPGKALLPVLAVAVLASSLPGLYSATHPGVVSFKATYAFPPSRLPEFVSGVLLGLLVFRHHFRLSENLALALLMGAALYLAKFGARLPSYTAHIITALGIQLSGNEPGYLRLPGYTAHNIVALPAIMALICVTANVEQSRYFRWVGSGFMQYLGRISFSFYIMQLPILILLEGLLAKNIVHRENTILALPILALNLLSAAALYELVEKRAHKFLLQKFLKKSVPAPVPA